MTSFFGQTKPAENADLTKDLELGSTKSSNSWMAWKSQEIKVSTPPPAGFLGGLRHKMSGVKSSVSASIEQQRNYPVFAALFLIGVAFLFLAFILIPTFVFAPQKVSLLISLGSGCILASFGALKGFYNYFVKELLCGPKRFFAVGYLISIILSVYASMIAKNYLFTLATLILEVRITLFIFNASVN